MADNNENQDNNEQPMNTEASQEVSLDQEAINASLREKEGEMPSEDRGGERGGERRPGGFGGGDRRGDRRGGGRPGGRPGGRRDNRDDRGGDYYDGDDDRKEFGDKRGRFKTFFKKKQCRFCVKKTKVNYLDPESLRRFVTERGKILPSRITGTCAKHQRRLATAIKRARVLALLPFVVK